MSEPRTEAGRALLKQLTAIAPDSFHDALRKRICAIEVEAAKPWREALAEVLPIASLSYDGDGWFAGGEHGIEGGYDECERRLDAARALLKNATEADLD